jgi:hypothetical protein
MHIKSESKPTPKALLFLVETMVAKGEDVESPEAIAWLNGLSRDGCSQALADRGMGTPPAVTPQTTLEQLGLEDAPATEAQPPKPWAGWKEAPLKLSMEDRLALKALALDRGIPEGYLTGQYISKALSNGLL